MMREEEKDSQDSQDLNLLGHHTAPLPAVRPKINKISARKESNPMNKQRKKTGYFVARKKSRETKNGKPNVPDLRSRVGWANAIEIGVVRASGLAKKNTVTGRSDPYAIVTLGGKVREGRKREREKEKVNVFVFTCFLLYIVFSYGLCGENIESSMGRVLGGDVEQIRHA